MSSVRRVSRKLIKTTKVHVNPRNTRLDTESLKRRKRSPLRERKRREAAENLFKHGLNAWEKRVLSFYTAQNVYISQLLNWLKIKMYDMQYD